MLTGLGRRLLDSCASCTDFGIESIGDGRMTVICDRGEISGCVQQFTEKNAHIGYA